MPVDRQDLAKDWSRGLRGGRGRVWRAEPSRPPPGANVTGHPRIVLAIDHVHPLVVSGLSAAIALRPGEVLLMPPGAWNQPQPGPARFYGSVTLQADGLRVFFRQRRGAALDTRGSPCWLHLLPAPEADEQALWRLCLEERDAATRAALVHALCQRCLQALRRAPDAADGGRRWAAIAAWIEEQLPLSPTRAATARQLGLHPTTLTRLCRQHTGMGFHAWRQSRQLGHARQQLHQHPQLGIAELARSCGFDDPRHFRQVYKRVFGIAPSRDRQGPTERAP
jgi:AraC-like DNA-binding protein